MLDNLISRVDVARVVAAANIGNVVADSATSVLDLPARSDTAPVITRTPNALVGQSRASVG